MKEEPKVGQTWSVFGEAAVCEIWGLRAGMAWVHSEHGDNSAINQSLLETMITDEHGNKPTEDNDDVVFYDVVKRDDGDYWVENKHGKSWIARTVSSTFGRADDEGRTCVGFLYHSEKGGYSFNDKAIDSCLIYFAPKAGSLEFIKDHIERERFSVPVKAVFKRLETR